jgi:hypothetical protein
VASLTYLPDNLAMTKNCSPAGNFQCPGMNVAAYAPGAANVVIKSAQIFLSQINQPTEAYCTGMKDTSGKALADNNGKALTTFFALHAQSEIMLNMGDVEGDYQFATLSDDGVVMQIDSSGTGKSYQDWVGSNGATHSNMVECAAQTVHLAPLVPLPIKLDYYQGPANEISFVLLWRKAPLTNEPECGKSEANDYFFDFASPDSGGACVATTASTPNKPWTDMLSRGWKVVPAANFYLPGMAINPCATK